MHGNSMIFDPLFSQKSISNQVKSFLNQSVMMGGTQDATTTTSFENTTSSTIINQKKRSSYRFQASAQSSMSLNPSQFGENSNLKVKRLLSQKLNRGVAVNPYYVGLLQRVSRGSSRDGFSSTHSVINVTRKATNNTSPSPKFDGNSTTGFNSTTRGGLASILDMHPSQKKKQKIRIYSKKSTRSNIKSRKVSSNLKPKTANPVQRNNYQLLDTSQQTSATTAFKSGDIMSTRLKEDDSQGLQSDIEKFQISKVVSDYSSSDFPPPKKHPQIPEEDNLNDEQNNNCDVNQEKACGDADLSYEILND